MLLTIDKVGGADKGRLHALHDGVAGQFGADRLADDGARAVATDQIATTQTPDGAGFKVAQGHIRRRILHHHVFDRRPVDDVDARLDCGVLEQDRFEKYLVDTVRRLRRRPVAIRPIRHGEPVAAARNRNSRQLLPGKRGAITDVVRIIRGQSGVAHLFRKAKPAEDFHGAGGDVVAFRIWRCCPGARLHHRDVDTSPRQIDRQREPDRASANDQHIRLNHFSHGSRLIRRVASRTCVCHSGSAPEFLTITAQRSTSVLM